jgi:hypothetical protein
MTSQHLDPHHKSAVNMIGYVLTLQEDIDIWRDLSLVLEVRLTPYERACLAFAVLDAVAYDDVFDIMEAVPRSRLAVGPPPPFLDLETEARWWAELATPAELEAWLTACFVRLPTKDQSAFLASARRRAAA